MKYLEITIQVPIVDLPEPERRELTEQMRLEPGDTLETLAEYVEAPDGANRISSAIASAIDLADRDEMFAGSEVYVTLPEFRFSDPETEVQVVSAKWVA